MRLVLGRPAVRPFQALKALLRDMRPATGPIAAWLNRSMQRRWSLQLDPDGIKWQPWAPYTEALAKDHPAWRMMQRTRALRERSGWTGTRDGFTGRIGMGYGLLHEKPRGKDPEPDLPRRAFLFGLSAPGTLRFGRGGDERYVFTSIGRAMQKASKK